MEPEDIIENFNIEQLIDNAGLKTHEEQQKMEKSPQASSELYIFPLIRRPFFPEWPLR